MMRIDGIERGVIATVAVFEPVANARDRTRAEFGRGNDISIFCAVTQHRSRLEARTYFDDFFFGEDIAQE